MLFGTFHNPREAEFDCGFEAELELALPQMLIGIDVHRPRRRAS